MAEYLKGGAPSPKSSINTAYITGLLCFKNQLDALITNELGRELTGSGDPIEFKTEFDELTHQHFKFFREHTSKRRN